MSHYDAIVIGSGLGGLTCGATLSKKGKKVLVLEQHNIIGGCATCFPRKGMLVDVGLHELDFGDRNTDIKYSIFDYLELWDKIKLIKLPTAWTIKVAERTYVIPHNNTSETLKKYFPHEKRGIDKYFAMLRLQARKSIKYPFDMRFFEFFISSFTVMPYHIYNFITNRTVGDILDKLIKDPWLKHILNINIGYYHNDPYRFIWSAHAVPQNGYYTQGMYLKGGSQTLSNALASIISKTGGEIRAKADVTNILLDGNKAMGVRYFDKKSGESIEVYADKIIANCDPATVYNKMLPQNGDYSKDLDLTKNCKRTTSIISLYMIFNKKPNEIYPDMDYSTFVVDPQNVEKEQKDIYDMSNINYRNADFTLVNYSKIDNGLSNRNDRHLIVLATLSQYEDWDGLDKETYQAKKTNVQKILEDRLWEEFPKLKEYLEHSELATPKTIERYIRTQKGTPYGYDQDRESFFGRERWMSHSVKNLYFASSFTTPGGGFSGAIIGGYRTGRKILDPYALPRKFTLACLFGFALSEGIQYLIKALI